MYEFYRYIANGLLATFIHYMILSFNLNVILMGSVGWANFIAAMVGISFSFLGSKYFVFVDRSGNFELQALKFLLLYGAMAVMHGIVLHFWSDRAHLGYTWGFLFATAIQMAMSFFFNKRFIFSK